MLTISGDVLIKGMEGLLPIRYRSNGHLPTIFCHALIKKMEGFLPIRYGSHGNMLTMSCHFLMDMMKGCLPSRNRHNGDMLTTSVNFLHKVVGECFQTRVFVLQKSWRDDCKFTLEVMETCLQFLQFPYKYDGRVPTNSHGN